MFINFFKFSYLWKSILHFFNILAHDRVAFRMYSGSVYNITQWTLPQKIRESYYTLIEI